MTELPKAYVAKDHEPRISDLWSSSGAFAPQGEGEPYSILMPPPNANESLHVGHALMITCEDIMARFARMQGKRVLWIPGTDHAGFETQVVYEKKLQKEDKSRFDFTPDVLRQNIRAYVDQQKTTIISQIKRLGASCDWSQLYFTLDPTIVDTVYATFSKMHHDGLLYRAKRLVNYCTKHGTSFSDLEVEYEERNDQLVYIKYPLHDAPHTFITVATTRPETMLGDTAVAVNPQDPRYKHLVGKHVVVPLVERIVPIVADDRVLPEFGSGAVKVTPAHSVIDAAMATDHHLPSIEVIDIRGKMCGDIPKQFLGLKSSQARQEIIQELGLLVLIEKTSPLTHRVGVCYKCKNPIEILPLQQWWVKTKPLAEKALQALRQNEITVTPKEAKKNLVSWLENINDWNISRQIVWGIPIPAWYKKDLKLETRNLKLGREEIKIQVESPGAEWVQDTDTFDTWFSSSQLPFAALGFPHSPNFKSFYPTSVMETGSDILYWWVSRMIILGLFSTNKVPFKHVYLHGLVLDSHGKKMSKSKGNVTDPIEIIDVYGTDALRWAVTHGTSAGQGFNMTLDRVIGGRNLANKLWNAGRYVLLSVEQKLQTPNSKFQPNSNNQKSKHLSLTPIWELGIGNWEFKSPINEKMIIGLQTIVTKVTECFEHDQYGLATDLLFDSFWHQFCDEYLETAKTLIEDKNTASETAIVLLTCLSTYLKLFHPIMPFVTEAIWQELRTRKLVDEPLLTSANWPHTPHK